MRGKVEVIDVDAFPDAQPRRIGSNFAPSTASSSANTISRRRTLVQKPKPKAKPEVIEIVDDDEVLIVERPRAAKVSERR